MIAFDSNIKVLDVDPIKHILSEAVQSDVGVKCPGK